MDIRNTQLHPDKYYHIYNRGINGTPVFFEAKNYHYFLQQYAKYVFPFVETYSYCLLENHYHLLIRIRSEIELTNIIKTNLDKPLHWHVSNGFSSFLQSYTRSINKMYNRSGALFEAPFKRIEVEEESYFTTLIAYIHCNPQKHEIVTDFRDYSYSSYDAHLDNKQTKLQRTEVLNWFGGRDGYIHFHQQEKISLSGNLSLE